MTSQSNLVMLWDYWDIGGGENYEQPVYVPGMQEDGYADANDYVPNDDENYKDTITMGGDDLDGGSLLDEDDEGDSEGEGSDDSADPNEVENGIIAQIPYPNGDDPMPPKDTDGDGIPDEDEDEDEDEDDGTYNNGTLYSQEGVVQLAPIVPFYDAVHDVYVLVHIDVYAGSVYIHGVDQELLQEFALNQFHPDFIGAQLTTLVSSKRLTGDQYQNLVFSAMVTSIDPYIGTSFQD